MTNIRWRHLASGLSILALILAFVNFRLWNDRNGGDTQLWGPPSAAAPVPTPIPSPARAGALRVGLVLSRSAAPVVGQPQADQPSNSAERGAPPIPNAKGNESGDVAAPTPPSTALESEAAEPTAESGNSAIATAGLKTGPDEQVDPITNIGGMTSGPVSGGSVNPNRGSTGPDIFARFDLSANSGHNIDPVVFALSQQGTNLDPSSLLFRDSPTQRDAPVCEPAENAVCSDSNGTTRPGGVASNFTSQGASPQAIQNLTAVPEPTTIVLLGTGLLAAFGARKRREQRMTGRE